MDENCLHDVSRLLHQLLEKEREYQTILHQVLKEREQEIKLLRLRSASAGPKSLMALTRHFNCRVKVLLQTPFLTH